MAAEAKAAAAAGWRTPFSLLGSAGTCFPPSGRRGRAVRVLLSHSFSATGLDTHTHTPGGYIGLTHSSLARAGGSRVIIHAAALRPP